MRAYRPRRHRATAGKRDAPHLSIRPLPIRLPNRHRTERMPSSSGLLPGSRYPFRPRRLAQMFLADRAGPAGQAVEVYFSGPAREAGLGVDRPRPERPGETMPLPDGTPTLEV